MTIRNGSWGGYEVLDQDGGVVAVVDTAEQATEIVTGFQEQGSDDNGSGDLLLGLF